MILKGDCIKVIKAMKPNSVDAIVTDPPYGLEFMGKEWDKLWDKRKFGIDEYSKKSFTCSDGSTRKTNPVSRKLNNPNYKAGIEAQLWHSQWLIEAYRVLKPGGSMLVMGGTRTSHRLACAIEDSGFIIKDTLMWIYGSGFPKAQDLGKMIDKRGGNGKHWDGFKVGGIKPAYEPIIWAVKPPEGSYVDNVLKWGVGAVNVDECRIEHNGDLTKGGCTKYGGMFGNDNEVNNPEGNPKGRFPANIILSHHPECVQMGMKRIKPNWSKPTRGKMDKSMFNVGNKQEGKYISYDDPDGYEQVESWDCHPDCAVRLLDEQSGERQSKWGKDAPDKISGNINYVGENRRSQQQFRGDSGGASRFFYCAKASRGERNAGLNELPEKDACHYNQSGRRYGGGNRENWKDPYKKPQFQNNHPTVKPIKLFEWLIKLVTREGQIVLDPFIGSGTTAIAAHNTGRKCVGIEKEEEYLEIAKRRTAYWRSRPRQLEMIGG